MPENSLSCHWELQLLAPPNEMPSWTSLNFGGGYEWIFLEEQGLEIEAGLTGLVGFCPAWTLFGINTYKTADSAKQ